MRGSSRREFLKQASVGAAAAGVVLASTAAAGEVRARKTSRSERRKLVEEAHFGRKKVARSTKGMAICSHPLATREAVNILRAGGNACDAALCASVTQTVVEPHMTGITGILSMLYYDAASKKTTYVNGNMNAPLAPLPGFNAADLAGGRGVGVPGWWAGFEAALERHGSKSKKAIMAAAIRYARDGFEIHPFLWGEMFEQCAKIGLSEMGREIFMRDKALLKPGEMLYQKKAADTLERLAEEGNDFFYQGDFAKEYCDVIQEAGGVMTPEDFARYEARWVEPAWGTYRGYDIAGSPPPDNGGTHIIEALNMIELMDMKKQGPPTDSPETLYQMVRICNLVLTEGGNQNDPESHPIPLDTIVSKEYARIRFELLKMGDARANTAETVPPPGSNHVTVADAMGNIATIIHSCMSLPWSNGLFAGGVTIVASGAHFMRVMPKPGYRATTMVAPTITYKNKKPILASGSPSVGLIPNILQNTTNIIDFGIPIEESVNRPRFGMPYLGPGNMIEADLDPKVRKEVEERGVTFEVVNPWNWHHGAFEGIYIDPNSREMIARGDARRCSKAEGV